MSVARTLDVAALGKLQKGFRGQLIVPGDSDYNRSRVDMKGAFLDEPSIGLWAQGGATANVAADAMAFTGRGAGGRRGALGREGAGPRSHRMGPRGNGRPKAIHDSRQLRE